MNDVPKPVKPLLPFTRPSIDEETIAAVAEVLRSGWLATGPKVAQLEADLKAALIRVELAVALPGAGELKKASGSPATDRRPESRKRS